MASTSTTGVFGCPCYHKSNKRESSMVSKKVLIIGCAGVGVGLAMLATLPSPAPKHPATLSTHTIVAAKPSPSVSSSPSVSPSPAVKPKPKVTALPVAKRPLPIVTPTPVPVAQPTPVPTTTPSTSPQPSQTPAPKYEPQANDVCPKADPNGIYCWHVDVVPSVAVPGSYDYSCFYAFTDGTWSEVPVKTTATADEALTCQS